jgi:hypothetical protein
VIAAVAAGVLLAAACSDDDTSSGGDGAGTAIDDTSAEPLLLDEITAAPELNASADPDFITEVMSDGVISEAELGDAFQRYIDCLAEGGAAGIYAFDLSLRVAFSDWAMADARADPDDHAVLSATCSRDFLGDLIPRYNEANPPASDLADRQRDSVAACIREIDPDIADAIPDVVTLDTTGAGAYLGDLQLDVTALGADADQVAAVDRCIGTLGVAWTAFG